MAIEVAFEDGKATGTFSMNGAEQADRCRSRRRALRRRRGRARRRSPRCRSRTATRTTYRNFDLQKQKVELKQLKVVGIEDVTVPAGTFKAWKVEVTSAEGEPGRSTLWIATDSRKVVKTTATLPRWAARS